MEQNTRFMTLHRLLECRLNLPTLESAGKITEDRFYRLIQTCSIELFFSVFIFNFKNYKKC